MDITTIRTDGLGDSTYVLTYKGQAVIVDPQRDIERILVELADVTPRFILETHLHNDYVSGARDLAKKTGAELVLPAAAAPAYRHTPAFHLEELDHGDGMTIQPLHTPGHTPEHTSYLIMLEDRPVFVFSGGSLLVGSAGRPDLLGEERADTLARLQYGSVMRLAQLPDDVGLYPTHGAGSFCTATKAARDTSTIGEEKKNNPVLLFPDEDTFVKSQLGGLVPYPRYYAEMGPANLYGYPPPPDSKPRAISADQLGRFPEAHIVDIRDRRAFAGGHIPGSIGIEHGKDFAVWTGWLLPFNAELVLVADQDQDIDMAIDDLSRIGFDRVVAVVTELSGYPDELRSYEVVTPEKARDLELQTLDVRDPIEWKTQHLDGSVWRYLPDLFAHGVPEAISRNERVLVVCRTGNRASIASSLLLDSGYQPVVVVDGGVAEMADQAVAHS
ncbi:MAG: MBL fold metallo-hydrolase [Acidimicrobiia bacterium]|nr:MBL fold metallo-hydrolase [Acidimicrobiia bacterium]